MTRLEQASKVAILRRKYLRLCKLQQVARSGQNYHLQIDKVYEEFKQANDLLMTLPMDD